LILVSQLGERGAHDLDQRRVQGLVALAERPLVELDQVRAEIEEEPLEHGGSARHGVDRDHPVPRRAGHLEHEIAGAAQRHERALELMGGVHPLIEGPGAPELQRKVGDLHDPSREDMRARSLEEPDLVERSR